MTRDEAIFLLMKCRPLAKKLVGQGIYIGLTSAEEQAMDGFGKVWGCGWLEGNSIQREAGLSSNEINSLTMKMITDVTATFIRIPELAATGS